MKYRDFALMFPSDYDRANPLTKGKGQLRLLSLKMSNEADAGKRELLMQQMATMRQQNTMNVGIQMQQYASHQPQNQ